jgi:hypothetical protein
VLSAGAKGHDQSGRVRVIVLIIVAVLVAGVAAILTRLGGEEGDTSITADEAGRSAVESGNESATAGENAPPVINVLIQLEQLVEEERAKALAIDELGSEASAGQMREVTREWHSWAAQFADRLDQVAAEMPDPPGEDSEQELKLGYHRMVETIEQLRRLLPTGSAAEVPRKIIRQSIFGIAANHLESAREYFYRIGL